MCACETGSLPVVTGRPQFRAGAGRPVQQLSPYTGVPSGKTGSPVTGRRRHTRTESDGDCDTPHLTPKSDT